jgi:hypothetical protein
LLLAGWLAAAWLCWARLVGARAPGGLPISALPLSTRHAAGPRPCWCIPHLQVVSLHCNLDANTRHLMNAERLNMMKRDAVLVNAARGPCVDEAALVAHLKANPNFRAGALFRAGCGGLVGFAVVQVLLWARHLVRRGGRQEGAKHRGGERELRAPPRLLAPQTNPINQPHIPPAPFWPTTACRAGCV